MFKSEAKLFLSANNNVNSAKTLINECKRLIVDFDLDGNSDCENLKNNINDCDINALVTKIEDTKQSLMKLDQGFAGEYMTLLQEYLQSATIDTSNMTDEEKMQYSIQMNSYARDYNQNLLYMLEKYEESGMLTEEMKQQLDYQKGLVAQYDIQDQMAVLDSTTDEYIKLFKQNADYDKRLIRMNPSLTAEQKTNYLKEYNIQYNQNLEALIKAKDTREKREADEKELEELYSSKSENNGFFHPFVESEIEEAILDKKIEMGIASDDEIEYKNKSGLARAWSNTGTFVASTFTGLYNVTEGISDGLVMLGSSVGICDKDWASEYISKDLSGELYQGIQLSTGMNSWSAYGKYHTAGEMFGNFSGKIGMTFAAPWANAVLSGVGAMGQSAENSFNEGDSYWAAFAKSLVSGVGGAAEGYGLSKLNLGIRDFAASGALKTVLGATKAGVKNLGATLTSPGGIKIVSSNLWNLAKSGMKNLPSKLGKAGLTTLKDADALIETGCVFTSNVIECVQSGKWNFKKMAAETGTVFATNYFMNFLMASAIDINSNKKSTSRIFDSYEELEDADSYLINSNKKSTSRIFDSYEEFKDANLEVRTQWEAGLSSREIELIENYIDENEISSYVTMNGIARDTCINTKKGTVKFYHAFGSPNIYTFDEYAEKYGESVIDLYMRTVKESEDLNTAICRCKLPQDTILARGMDANALKRFKININSDSAETILAKLGGTYSDAGFMSCTPVAGGGFTAKRINLIMDCPAGSPCADLASFNHFEQEVLFPMKQEFSVDNVVKKDGKVYIYMTLKLKGGN